MRVALVLALCLLAGLTEALRLGRAFARDRKLYARKLDGITIEGDLQPMANNLLIKVKEALAETKGGLFIPDNAKERPTEGTVIAHGPGRIHPETALLLNIAVKTGTNVIYGKYDGSELKYDGEPHQLIKDDDVLLTYPVGQEATVANVECVKDQVLIEFPPREQANNAGIIIATPTEGEKKRPDHGTVVKIGPGRQAGNGKVMEIQVKPGDKVRFRDFAGSEIKLGTTDYLVIRAYDILAKW
jgi:chaperonin GroES